MNQNIDIYSQYASKINEVRSQGVELAQLEACIEQLQSTLEMLTARYQAMKTSYGENVSQLKAVSDSLSQQPQLSRCQAYGQPVFIGQSEDGHDYSTLLRQYGQQPNMFQLQQMQGGAF
jgi:chromosome segregation ATPase